MRTVYFELDVPRVFAVKALRRLWPGVIWSPLGVTHVGEWPDPSLPGAGWVRVRNHQCGIDTTDLSLIMAAGDPTISLAALPYGRVYMGHEVVGTVTETGSPDGRFHVGDRVVMAGRSFSTPDCFTLGIEPRCRSCAAGRPTLCENSASGSGVGVGGGWGDSYTAHEAQIWRVPDGLSDDQAALIEPAGIAVHSVLRRPPGRGEKVLVLGAGIIGLLVLQAAKAIEPAAHATVLARHAHQASAARAFGADEVVSGGDLYPQMARITGARLHRAPLNRGTLRGGYDIVYDCVGSGSTLLDALRWTRAQGTVVVIGVHFGVTRTDLTPVWHQEVDLIGSGGYGRENWNGASLHTFALVIQMFQQGRLRADGLITHRFPLRDYKRAVATAADKRTGSIKVMLEIERSGS